MIWRSPARLWGLGLLAWLVARNAAVSDAGGGSGAGFPGGPSAPDDSGSTEKARRTFRASMLAPESSCPAVPLLIVTASELPSISLTRPSVPESARKPSSSPPEDRPVAMSTVPAPPMASTRAAAAPAAARRHRRCQPAEGAAGRSNRGWTRAHRSDGAGASLPSARSASLTRRSISPCCSLMPQPPVLNSPVSPAVARAPCSTATSPFPHGRPGRSPLPSWRGPRNSGARRRGGDRRTVD